MQESLLHITLVDPAANKHSLTVSPAECPIELKSTLLNFAPTCLYTQYYFSHNGSILLNFTDFSSQQVSQGTTLTMVPEAYDEKGFKFHYKRSQHLLVHPPSERLCISESNEEILENETGNIELPDLNVSELAVDLQALQVPTSQLPPLRPNSDEYLALPVCLLSLALTQQNPPKEHRRAQGDLGYLEVVTLERSQYFITGSVVGFFVNKSDPGSLRPELADKSQCATTLIGLLKKLSPLFEENFTQLLLQAHLFDSLDSAKPLIEPVTWLYRPQERKEENFNEFNKNWNDELQLAKSLPSESPIQRIQKDKALCKIYSDFTEAAVAGAKLVIQGGVQPLNPMDPARQHLFVFNYMFFSYTADIEYEVIFKQ